MEWHWLVTYHWVTQCLQASLQHNPTLREWVRTLPPEPAKVNTGESFVLTWIFPCFQWIFMMMVITDLRSLWSQNMSPLAPVSQVTMRKAESRSVVKCLVYHGPVCIWSAFTTRPSSSTHNNVWSWSIRNPEQDFTGTSQDWDDTDEEDDDAECIVM